MVAVAVLVVSCTDPATGTGEPTTSADVVGSEGSTAPLPDGAAAEPADAVYLVVAEACDSGVEAVATGVAIAERHIVTVAHTLAGAASVVVAGAGDRQSAEVVWLDADRDLAVLELGDDAAPWLPLGSTAPGAAVTVLSAAGQGVEAKPAEVVRLLDVTLDGVGNRAGLELEARIDPGDSGAPVVSEAGEVVGLVFATERDDTRGWAIAAAEIEAALASRQSSPVRLSC